MSRIFRRLLVLSLCMSLFLSFSASASLLDYDLETVKFDILCCDRSSSAKIVSGKTLNDAYKLSYRTTDQSQYYVEGINVHLPFEKSEKVWFELDLSDGRGFTSAGISSMGGLFDSDHTVTLTLVSSVGDDSVVELGVTSDYTESGDDLYLSGSFETSRYTTDVILYIPFDYSYTEFNVDPPFPSRFYFTADGLTVEDDYQGSADVESSDLSSSSSSTAVISRGIQGLQDSMDSVEDGVGAIVSNTALLVTGQQDVKTAVNNVQSAIRSTAQDIQDNVDANTDKLIANDDSNTEKVTTAIEAHGNFIIEGLKSLFIPSDDFFKTYFDDLYEWFSDKFGFLTIPLDIFIQLVSVFTGSSDSDFVLTLPALSIMDESVWVEQSFNVTEFLNANFPFLLEPLHWITSLLLVGAFLRLCRYKYYEVMWK